MIPAIDRRIAPKMARRKQLASLAVADSPSREHLSRRDKAIGRRDLSVLASKSGIKVAVAGVLRELVGPRRSRGAAPIVVGMSRS